MNIIRAIGVVAGRMLTSFLFAFKKNLKALSVVFSIFAPLLILWLNMSLVDALIFLVVLNLVCTFIKNLHYELNSTTQTGFPISPHRYTERNPNGTVSVSLEDQHEALLYLCDVEDYLKSKGMI